MKSTKKALLLFEDGTQFEGYAIGKTGTSGGEICFNTGMTGYQEIYTDPSYYGQIIISTNAHIGNYGVLGAEQESDQVQIKGLICNYFSPLHSRASAEQSLQEYFEKYNIVGIQGVDTRKIVQHIRQNGAMNVIISSEIEDWTHLKEALKKIPQMKGLELSSKVSTKEAYTVSGSDTYKVAVLDLGVKKSILKHLVKRGCELKVFPAQTDFLEMQTWHPDAYFISNGPGDPAAMPYAIDTVKAILKQNIPLFGICLGHQILALANGVSTYKMHHGHRGINHPVKNIITGHCEITSQNHGFGINKEEIQKHQSIEVTHVNLNDHSIEGIRMKDQPAFSVQYHPEASPGPHDSHYLFDDFIQMIHTQKYPS